MRPGTSIVVSVWGIPSYTPKSASWWYGQGGGQEVPFNVGKRRKQTNLTTQGSLLTCAKECGLGSTLQVLVLTATLPSQITSNAVLCDLIPAREWALSTLKWGTGRR